jgi:tetratricopeptide (TPR) repeat protein
MALLERDGRPLTEAPDVTRVDQIATAYASARAVLADDHKRGAYDRELAGGELVEVPPAIDTELNFRLAEELMARRQWEQAIGQIKAVIAEAPNEADYHAALGWSEWMGGAQQAEAADAARPYLNRALEINPDHAAAHDYKGRIGAQLHTDDSEALFHLERAIDLDCSRIEAVSTIEGLLVARGELRRWERILKRLLFQLRGKGNLAEVKAWVRLARLYFDHLDDPQAGAAAAVNARRISPDDPDVVGVMARGGPHRRSTLEPIRAGWREALADPSSGAELVRNAEASGHADAAFLAASTMVALGTADSTMAAQYEAKRVRTVLVPATKLDRDHWSLLRHRDDNVELGALIELVAPAVHALAPMTLAESDLDPSLRLDADLPAPFARLRARYAELLGVPVAPVFARVDLGAQIHVVATDPPVLVAGDEALTAPERPELVFRLARAMTFLWPGRAVGASRPARVLRALVLAVFREASDSTIGSEEPLAMRAAEAIGTLPDAMRTQARAAALRLLSRGGGLNLSVWARSLTRTADRAGMLLSGDIPAAFAGAKEVGELERDLVEFAYSAAHVNLRSLLGLTTRA